MDWQDQMASAKDEVHARIADLPEQVRQEAANDSAHLEDAAYANGLPPERAEAALLVWLEEHYLKRHEQLHPSMAQRIKNVAEAHEKDMPELAGLVRHNQFSVDVRNAAERCEMTLQHRLFPAIFDNLESRARQEMLHGTVSDQDVAKRALPLLENVRTLLNSYRVSATQTGQALQSEEMLRYGDVRYDIPAIGADTWRALRALMGEIRDVIGTAKAEMRGGQANLAGVAKGDFQAIPPEAMDEIATAKDMFAQLYANLPSPRAVEATSQRNR